MEVLVFVLLAVAAFIAVIVYVLYGVTNALVLTWRCGEAIFRGEPSRPWSFVVGAGWFLLLGGLDLVTADGPDSHPCGDIMVALSFAAWIAAGLLVRRETPQKPAP